MMQEIQDKNTYCIGLMNDKLNWFDNKGRYKKEQNALGRTNSNHHINSQIVILETIMPPFAHLRVWYSVMIPSMEFKI